MKTFKFSLVLRTRENTDVFITLDENIYGIHSKRVNILYLCIKCKQMVAFKCHNIRNYNNLNKNKSTDSTGGSTVSEYIRMEKWA